MKLQDFIFSRVIKSESIFVARRLEQGQKQLVMPAETATEARWCGPDSHRHGGQVPHRLQPLKWNTDADPNVGYAGPCLLKHGLF